MFFLVLETVWQPEDPESYSISALVCHKGGVSGSKTFVSRFYPEILSLVEDAIPRLCPWLKLKLPQRANHWLSLSYDLFFTQKYRYVAEEEKLKKCLWAYWYTRNPVYVYEIFSSSI